MKNRLDKILSESNILSRSESKSACRKGRISVNGITIKSSDEKVDESDIICLDGKEIVRRRFFYIMMNKPQGYVCSTDDGKSKTVLELLSDEDRPYDIFPAGRLDKDTVGFVFLTNDGELAHGLLSPSKHVKKEYIFKSQLPLSESDISKITNGIMLDGDVTKKCELCEYNDKKSGDYVITLTEGRYHQIKRMLESVNNRITYLKRVSFGGICLDGKLKEGEYRHLTDDEVSVLKSHCNMTK